MKVEIQVNNSNDPKSRYLGWAPSACRVRVVDTTGLGVDAVDITIGGKSAASGGAVSFRQNTTGRFGNQITLSVPPDGSFVSFFTAGKFGSPSAEDGDVAIEARSGATLVGSTPVMVRIRKNATSLTDAERDRFVTAFALLNGKGMGRFKDFRDMHVAASIAQAHGNPGFPPWHRAYILDLERNLQAIDPSVALPYWRFDQPAPNIFTPEFLGGPAPMGGDQVYFNTSNPLQFWVTDGQVGVDRRANFNLSSKPPGLLTEAQTLALGSAFRVFRQMEGNPHGSAHTSFTGPIDSVPTAARDPLFFLLHCNVDRLWAKWQKKYDRFDPAVTDSFDSSRPYPPGHNLKDTMWPWNGVTGAPRPPTAPGGPMADSLCVSAPGPQPRVMDVLDYQGLIASSSVLGFDYDDISFA